MKLGKKDLSVVSVMLFALFFGAGNLIFPPFLGQNAGDQTLPAMLGFLATAVILPVLGVVVVARFDGLEKLIQKRMAPAALGFDAPIVQQKKDLVNIFRQVTPQDLMKFGLVPELVGRLPVITTLDDLDEEALIRILTEPKNALVKQYQKLFDFDDIELELTDDALNAIAAEAIARKTGARGLRSIMEGTLMDTMYTTPSVENVKKIVVDADCVKGTAKPRFYDASGKEITNVPQGI